MYHSSCILNILSKLPLMGNVCSCKKKPKKKIVLLLLGLDNAGKTVTAKGLAGEEIDDSTVPTVGFSVINLKYKDCIVKIFDLGGGPSIRDIWTKYFVDAHGIIFVVDSSDISRMFMVKVLLEGVLAHGKIRGKPVLLLANKQDQDEALDEVDLMEKLDLETLVNKYECPTLLETCTANKVTTKCNLKIKKGYEWLVETIIRNYNILNQRVEEDVAQQIEVDQKIREEKLKRIRREVEQLKEIHDQDMIESYSEYNRKILENQIESFETEDDKVLSTSSSAGSFTAVINVQPIAPRPKSATQLVKEQLELNGNPNKRFISKISARNNKINPDPSDPFIVRPRSSTAVLVKQKNPKCIKKMPIIRVKSAPIGDDIELSTCNNENNFPKKHLHKSKAISNGGTVDSKAKYNGSHCGNKGDIIAFN